MEQKWTQRLPRARLHAGPTGMKLTGHTCAGYRGEAISTHSVSAAADGVEARKDRGCEQ